MITTENGYLTYVGDTFKIRLIRYSDPYRLHAARNAARYLGKKDLDNIKRPLNIIKEGHVAEVFRGEHAEFEFEDVSKEVYDHLVTYTTRNMRVAGGNRALKSNDYTLPSDKVKNLDLVNSMIDESMQNYKFLMDNKETPQVARSAMPVAAKLNIFVYQFNFLTLGQALFKQRIWEKGAQGNTVKVIQALYALVHQVDPELWETFYEWNGAPATEWVEVRRKLQKSQMTILDLRHHLHAAMMGELTDRKGNKLEPINADTLAVEVLRKLFGEQKSMW